jgi:pimeloyl-ACP methyl ester carboxylesterase
MTQDIPGAGGVSQTPARRIEIAGLSGLELGPPSAPVELVFLHANGFHAALYADMLAPLAVGRRVIAFDHRGQGCTALPADPTTIKDWTIFRDDALRALEAIGGPPVVLAGHSLGASVALLAAAKEPERARALALIEPVIGPPWRHFALRCAFLRWLGLRRIPLAVGAAKRRRRFASFDAAFEAYKGRGGFRTWPDAALRAYVEGGFKPAEDGEGGVVLRCDPAWEAAIFVAHGADVWGALYDAPAPIFIRAGASYTTFPPSSERRMRAIRQDVDFERVEGTTHFLPQERPDVAQAVLLKAMDRRSQPRASG